MVKTTTIMIIRHLAMTSKYESSPHRDTGYEFSTIVRHSGVSWGIPKIDKLYRDPPSHSQTHSSVNETKGSTFLSYNNYSEPVFYMCRYFIVKQ